jgi:hypothetical protein
LNDAKLANAFIIENIPYCWKKGKTEQWKKEENFRVLNILSFNRHFYFLVFWL